MLKHLSTCRSTVIVMLHVPMAYWGGGGVLRNLLDLVRVRFWVGHFLVNLFIVERFW